MITTLFFRGGGGEVGHVAFGMFPRETFLSGDERGETSAVRMLH